MQNLKVIVVGDCNVGKTNLILRYTKNIFVGDIHETVGVDLLSKEEEFGTTQIVMEIADTGGQERFRALTSSYYRYADGVIVVFDTTNRKSFDQLPSWLDEVKLQSSEFVHVLIVGNKSDSAQKVVSEEEAIQFAKIHGPYSYIETSAKYNYNVDHIFKTIAQETLERRTCMTRCTNNYNRLRKKKKSNSTKVREIFANFISTR